MNARLRASLLQQAIANIQEGIVIIDATAPGHPVIYVNAAFEAMTGYDAAEILGRGLGFLQGDGQGRPGVEAMDQAVRDGQGCTVTLQCSRKDGTLFWDELSLSPVHGEGGRVTHFIGVHKDVTHRVDSENRLRQAKEELERANTRLSHEATRDPLTGIGNRRSFQEQADQEWRRGLRSGQTLSCFMIDIDFFKRYNDAYGHQAGDTSLRQVARAVEDSFRRGSDLVARYGGEEFVVLSAGLTPQEALEQARTVCRRVGKLGLPHRDSRAAAHVTVSVGVATVTPDASSSLADLVAAADRGLYRAKAGGRDRAVQAAPEMG